MCKRKIIRTNPDSESVVPLLNGCECPMIKEFRHIHPQDNSPEGSKVNLNIKKRREYSMPPGCYDMHTQIESGVPGHQIIFRHCECFHPSEVCMNLAPLLYYSEPAFDLASLEENEDDEDENPNDFDGGMGLRPRSF